MGLDLRKRFFFDRGDDDIVALSASRVEHEKGEAAVASNETEFGVRRGQ
jgi:hypothetical protein